MENYTRVGTPVQVLEEGTGFIPAVIAAVEGSRVDVIGFTKDGMKSFENISHFDFRTTGDAKPFYRFIPREHCYSETIPQL
jgi:hypothetical protein